MSDHEMSSVNTVSFLESVEGYSLVNEDNTLTYLNNNVTTHSLLLDPQLDPRSDEYSNDCDSAFV